MDTLRLEQSLASAVRYIQNRSGIETAPYFDEEPEAYMVPSLYFPVPWTRSKKVTLSTYRSSLIINCQFMASTDWEAYQTAVNVRDCILLDGCCIPLMKKDGTLEKTSVRIVDPEVKRIERGIVQLSFELQHYFTPTRPSGPLIENFIIDGIIKPDSLYEAWYAATEELRKEQEVQRKCLETAMENL